MNFILHNLSMTLSRVLGITSCLLCRTWKADVAFSLGCIDYLFCFCPFKCPPATHKHTWIQLQHAILFTLRFLTFLTTCIFFISCAISLPFISLNSGNNAVFPSGTPSQMPRVQSVFHMGWVKVESALQSGTPRQGSFSLSGNER